jgi:hypothetical protein
LASRGRRPSRSVAVTHRARVSWPAHTSPLLTPAFQTGHEGSIPFARSTEPGSRSCPPPVPAGLRWPQRTPSAAARIGQVELGRHGDDRHAASDRHREALDGRLAHRDNVFRDSLASVLRVERSQRSARSSARIFPPSSSSEWADRTSSRVGVGRRIATHANSSTGSICQPGWARSVSAWFQ